MYPHRFSFEELKELFTEDSILEFFEQMDEFNYEIRKQTADKIKVSFPAEESITDFLALALSRVQWMDIKKVGKTYEKKHGCDFIIEYFGKTLGLQAKNTGTLTKGGIIGKMEKNQIQAKIIADDPDKGYIFYYTRANGSFCLALLVRLKNGSNIKFYNKIKNFDFDFDGADSPNISLVEITRNGNSLEAKKVYL
ncbi:hypothetical protein ACTFIZ_003186 [Dictyostelium cf. discoideum]